MSKLDFLRKNLVIILGITILFGCGGNGGNSSNSQTAALTSAVKVAFGADPTKTDTDGDGLSDEFEIKFGYPFFKPDSSDTNGNGVSDAAEDSDGDGLTNYEEQQFKTNPLSRDTDDDGLSDKDEIVIYKTNPLKKDTDSDGINDDRELQNGSNPLVADSNKVVTSRKTHTVFDIVTGKSEPVSVSVTGPGDLADKISVKNLTDTKLSGQVSNSYEIGYVVGIDPSSINAEIVIPYDPSLADAADPSAIAIFTINPKNGSYEELSTVVDPVAKTLTAKTTHFSPFWAVNKNTFNEFISKVPQTCDLVTDPNAKPADVVLVIDSSGSMSWNDPDNFRLSAAKSFISKMKATDRVAVVDFDFSAKLASGFSGDKNIVAAAVDTIDSSGGTNIGAGISIALNQFLKNSDISRNRVVILLTDGDGEYDPALTTQMANAGIRAFTIGLTGSVNTSLLQSIASETNGGYKQIASANGLDNIFTEFANVFGDTGIDTDGDGLTDCQETQGIYVMTGKLGGTTIKTNPAVADSDGDGIPDGSEIGVPYRAPLVVISTPWAVQSLNSDPNKSDSDGDQIDDPTEKTMGTNPLHSDSDSDGLSDYAEITTYLSDPLNPNTDGDSENDFAEVVAQTDPTQFNSITGWNWFSFKNGVFITLDTGFDVALGAVCGDAICNIESVPELIGAIAGGLFPPADVRDVLAYSYQGEPTDAAISALGLLPITGDAVKGAKLAVNFLKKYPQKTVEVTAHLDKMGASGRAVLKLLPAVTKSSFWDTSVMNAFKRGRHIETLNAAELGSKYPGYKGVYTNVYLIDVYKYLSPGQYIIRSDKSLDFFAKTYQESGAFKAKLRMYAKQLNGNEKSIRIPPIDGNPKFIIDPANVSSKELFITFPKELPSSLQKEFDTVVDEFPGIKFIIDVK